MKRIEYVQMSTDEHRAVWTILSKLQLRIHDSVDCIRKRVPDELIDAPQGLSQKSIADHLRKIYEARAALVALQNIFSKSMLEDADLVKLAKEI